MWKGKKQKIMKPSCDDTPAAKLPQQKGIFG
jgi:hypothetical protein